jgi:hypothetical protein
MMNFSAALACLKCGEKVSRKTWKGAFIYLQEGSVITKEQGRNEILKNIDGNIKINPHIDMKCKNGSIDIGWSPNQSDMFTDDWEIA